MAFFAYPRSRTISARSLTWIWLTLVVITVGSWLLAPARFSHAVDASASVTALVLVLTFVKSRLIIRYFMEVGDGPRWLKLATDAWLAVLMIAVFGVYLA